MDKQIIYYYQRGVASYLIAQRFGVSNAYVRKLLARNKVPVRGHDVTNKMSADKRTPEENRRITAKAAQKNRGSEHTLLHRSRLAVTREKNPVVDPVYEKPLVDLCRTMRIDVVPQKAFNKFNVDLYFVQENVVVEIFGGGFHNKKDAVDLFNNKIKYLSRKKIPVIVVWADKLTYQPLNVIKLTKLAKKPLTIVTGDGTPTNRGLGDIILPLV